MENPLVTICFVTYGWADKLEKSIQPLLDQSYQNIQLIICDDNSPDNTQEVIGRIQQKYPNVTSRKNIREASIGFQDVSVKIPGGANTKTFDILFDHCNSIIKSGIIKGEFVIFCHQDDLYDTSIIQKQVAFLLANPNVPGVFTRGDVINQDDKVIKEYPFAKELEGKTIFTFKEIFGALLSHGNFLITPSLMMRTDIFEKVGLFDDRGPFGGSDDLEMWLRILEKYPIGILQEKLIKWRTDGRGKKYNKLRTDKADFFKLMDYYLYDKKYAAAASARQLRQYEFQKDFDNTLCAMNFLIKGEIPKARKLINSSFKLPHFQALLENPTLLRAKVTVLKIILFAGINLGFGEQLAKVLHRFA